jgi:hypothetical protein
MNSQDYLLSAIHLHYSPYVTYLFREAVGGRLFRNICDQLQDYKVSQPGRPQYESSMTNS